MLSLKDIVDRANREFDMAKIWPVYAGTEPTRGVPWAELPFAKAISLFELGQDNFISGLQSTPRFGDQNRASWNLGFKYIVVEVDPSEAEKAKWQAGFYKSQLTPDEAFNKLIQYVVASEFGEEDVLRVTHDPATDSWGNAALRITVVVAPQAVNKLASGKTLDALIKLKQQLWQMREERTPIIEYATEEELSQDATT
jgi:hypothetical protein